MVGDPTEADTCRDFVVPRLLDAGWREDQIVEQHFFTDGRVIPSPRGHRRQPGKRTDYLLEIEPGLPLAVVEAKRLYKHAHDGLQQAMRYAEILRLPLAYGATVRASSSTTTTQGSSTRSTPSPGPTRFGGATARGEASPTRSRPTCCFRSTAISELPAVR